MIANEISTLVIIILLHLISLILIVARPFNLHVSIIIGFVLSLAIGEAFFRSFQTINEIVSYSTKKKKTT